MAVEILDFFGLLGTGISVPTNLGELVVFVAVLFVGLFIVTTVMRFICSFVGTLFDRRRYM